MKGGAGGGNRNGGGAAFVSEKTGFTAIYGPPLMKITWRSTHLGVILQL
jgi:hypothetical protein